MKMTQLLQMSNGKFHRTFLTEQPIMIISLFMTVIVLKMDTGVCKYCNELLMKQTDEISNMVHTGVSSTVHTVFTVQLFKEMLLFVKKDYSNSKTVQFRNNLYAKYHIPHPKYKWFFREYL
jgi:hypothetical protein